MPEQSFTIPQQLTFTDSSTQKQWRLDDGDAILVDDALTPTGTTRYLRRVIVRNDQGDVLQVRLQFGSDTTETAPSGGDDLVAAWEEQDDDAIFFEQGAVSLGVGGPNASSNESQDTSEPYTFFPPDADQALLTTFFFVTLDTDADWTLRLNLAQVAPASHAVDGGSIAVDIDLPEPTRQHNRSHAVDGSSISVEVELPEPSVDHTAAGGTGTDHEISGGSIGVDIDLPEPTVTHNRSHAVDGGSISVEVELPEPDVEVAAFIVTNVARPRGINTVLVDIDIPSGPTLRYSTVPIRVGGQHYESRLRSVPEVEHSIGSLRRPRFLIPKVTLTISESSLLPADQQMITLFGRYQGLATATITIRWGTGSTLADYTTIFTGHVLVPGGKRWEEDKVTLNLASSAQRANKLATAAATADGVAYPRLFGDYTEAPQQWLPATALSARSHLLAHPDDIERVAQVRQTDGTAITGWTLDATTGIITVPADQEAIEVLAEGTQYNRSWKMDALCRWLLGEVAGVADTSLDLPTWTALTADVETDVRGRCYLQPPAGRKSAWTC